jgi:hypothetical protein
MRILTATCIRELAGFAALFCFLAGSGQAQTPADSLDVKISPIALSANVPGIEITQATINRLAAQSELTVKQIENLDVVAGKYDTQGIAKMIRSADDFPARRFVEFMDGNFGKVQDRAEVRNWQAVAKLEPFIEDAVTLGGLDPSQEQKLRSALEAAAVDGDTPQQVAARGTAYALLSDVRQAALKTARGFRQVSELLRKELESREFVQNIGLVVELRTTAKQPTISPLFLVTMECDLKTAKPAPKLVFSQRKRECNDQGVCRLESIAEVSKGNEYMAVFDALQRNGRSYLDGCMLNANMLVDGTEIQRTLPGKFMSHTAPSP